LPPLRRQVLAVGFAAPVAALSAHREKLYAGDLTGTIYSVSP